MLVSYFVYSSTLKLEAEVTCYSETSVDFQQKTEIFITITVRTSIPTKFNLITSVLKAVIVTNALNEINLFVCFLFLPCHVYF
jgi:hypothetical protein